MVSQDAGRNPVSKRVKKVKRVDERKWNFSMWSDCLQWSLAAAGKR